MEAYSRPTSKWVLDDLCISLQVLLFSQPEQGRIRKLCCRKDDRAMSPIYGCPEILGTPWLRPWLLFPTFFHGLLFQPTLWMFLQNLKSVALPVPEIIGGTQTIWTVPGYAHAPFSPKFLMGFIRIGPVNVPAKFEVRSFSCSWGDSQVANPNFEEGEAIGGRDGTIQKSVGEFL